MKRMLWRRYELLADLEDNAADALAREGIGPHAARRAALALVDIMARHWAGQVLSFPIGTQAKVAARDAEILARFDTDGPDVLAREFGISSRGVRKAHRRAQTRQSDAEAAR